MSLLEFIFDSHNLIFSTALALMLFIALLEGVSTILGAGISNLLETLLPEFDVAIEAPDAPPASALSRFLGWLHVGKVPVLIILIVFLTAFGLLGYGIQSLLLSITGSLWFGWLIGIGAFFAALPVTRILSAAMGHIIPQDESSAISENDYVGRIATITLGNAKKGYPAEAKLTDSHGQTHYIMIEPETDAFSFDQGEEVLVVQRDKNLFLAIKNTHAALSDNL